MEGNIPIRERKALPLPSPSPSVTLERAPETETAPAAKLELGVAVKQEPKVKKEEEIVTMASPDVKEPVKGDVTEEVKKDAKEVDDDPIVAEFEVFIKPQMIGDRQFFVLQYPNRDKSKPYDAAHGCAPLELRVKPKAGMVEVDVPLDVHRNYDRTKGIKWGEALKKSEMAKGGGSHGLPGGFGIGGAAPAGRGRGRGEAEEAENQEKLLANYDQAVEDGHVLKKQTLGGQFLPKNENSPQYMVGTFTNGQLHLTPVDQIIPLRPQFHHIDAAAEQDRLSRARDAGAGRVIEARALHMSVKSSIDGEENNTTTMADRIAAVQAEPWRRHDFIDSETPEAWKVFNENMFVGGAMGQNTEELLAKVPKLISGVNDEEYLDMISAPRDKARLSKNKKNKSKSKAKKGRDLKKGKGKEGAVEEEDGSSSTMSDPSSGSDTDDVEVKAKAKAKS